MRMALALAFVVLATAALAADRRGSATLSREATPARLARLAEIAKDATPPKPGGSRRSYDTVKVPRAGERRAAGR